MERGGAHILFWRSETLRLHDLTTVFWQILSLEFPPESKHPLQVPQHSQQYHVWNNHWAAGMPRFLLIQSSQQARQIASQPPWNGYLPYGLFQLQKTLLRTAKAPIKIFSAVRFIGYFLPMIKIQLFASAWEQVRDQSNPALIYWI